MVACFLLETRRRLSWWKVSKSSQVQRLLASSKGESQAQGTQYDQAEAKVQMTEASRLLSLAVAELFEQTRESLWEFVLGVDFA